MAFSVDEEAIKSNLKHIYDEYQIWIGPEGAATIAALEQAIEHDLIQSGDKVVAFNTGSFEKYLPNIRPIIF
ncbi:MAG: threonine synthase, partial [Gammaproteobacteria bacterium]|nr:threonine synthase [Gammaproteobacteria bacterium]